MLKKVCAITFLLTFLPAQPSAAQWNHPLPFAVYRSLSNCETGTNLGHITKTYVGAYGFTKTVWGWYSSTPARKAHTLTFAQQSRVLDRAFFFGYKSRAAVGPWGHGCWKRLWLTNHELRVSVCNNGKRQVRRWCRPI